jgi:hypothetical protein
MSDTLRMILDLVFFIVSMGGFMAMALWVMRYDRKRKAQTRKERVDAIRAKEGVWGKAICDLLIFRGFTVDDPKVNSILARLKEWGEDTCKSLLENDFTLGMTKEMVRVVLGSPHKIDNEDISRSSKNERWIYGRPCQDAVYIWFSNEEVTRIRRTGER